MSFTLFWAVLSTATVGEDAIVIGNCDIRNALLDQTACAINGYSPKFAVQLIDTLLDE